MLATHRSAITPFESCSAPLALCPEHNEIFPSYRNGTAENSVREWRRRRLGRRASPRGGTQPFPRGDERRAGPSSRATIWRATSLRPPPACACARIRRRPSPPRIGIVLRSASGPSSRVLLRRLPTEPDQLARVGFITTAFGLSGDLHSPATYFHFAKARRSFTELGAIGITNFTYRATAPTRDRRPETPSDVTLLLLLPLLGRLFEPGDTCPGMRRMFPFPSPSSTELLARLYCADPSDHRAPHRQQMGSRAVIVVLPRTRFFRGVVDSSIPAPVARQNGQITCAWFQLDRSAATRASSPSAAEAELNALIPGLSERFSAYQTRILQHSRARVSVVPLTAARWLLCFRNSSFRFLVAPSSHCDQERGQPLSAPHERSSQRLPSRFRSALTRVRFAQRFLMEGMVLASRRRLARFR